MSLGAMHDELVVQHRANIEVAPGDGRAVTSARSMRFSSTALHDVRRVAGRDHDVERREAMAQIAQHRRQQIDARGGAGPDAHAALPFRRRAAPSRRRQQRPAAPIPRAWPAASVPAAVGVAWRPTRSISFTPKPPLKLAHLLAHGRLRDAEQAGGRGASSCARSPRVKTRSCSRLRLANSKHVLMQGITLDDIYL